ncbi:hypothetical protein G7Y89_g2181 [Cudoniella acicularis]|uniref:Uncharacterized protein n=1 Tax=Cudoniella acicularis TaxID=354080 RepID=A0A8H4W777_9HELO|nr:hypothetical protein G7Y89_g2181 [Cudoniella acicularis]
MSDTSAQRGAWVTLLTQESYLLGVVLLAYSLHKQNSRYPLIILYTPSLPSSTALALSREAALTNAFLIPTKMLQPKEQRETLIAERSKDTWTKLHVGIEEYG